MENKSISETNINSIPVEMVLEIGSNLDILSMISMSFVCKDFQDIYQQEFQKIVKELDPYITNGTVYDFLKITRVCTVEQMVYKIWRNIFEAMIKEMENIYPTIKRRNIIETFVRVIPLEDVENLKVKIKNYVSSCDIFICYKDVIYKNPYSLDVYNITEFFESDIIDMVDGILHELSIQERTISRDNSIDSITSDESIPQDDDSSLGDSMEYFPYENIMETFENTLKLI